MTTRILSRSFLLAVLSFAAMASAEPRNSVWVEDVRLEPEGGAETAFVYEFQSPDLAAIEEGVDLFALRLAAGVTDGLEFAPAVQLRQRGREDLRLHEIGGAGRVRLLGDMEAPHLVAYGAYFNDLSDARDHHVSLGGAGRYDISRLLLGADLRASAGFGGESADSVELWLGAMAGYSVLPDRRLTAGLESFVIAPVTGARISDPTFGASADSVSFYYGPVLSLRGGPIWTAISAATGFPISEPASHLLVRWMVGVEH